MEEFIAALNSWDGSDAGAMRVEKLMCDFIRTIPVEKRVCNPIFSPASAIEFYRHYLLGRVTVILPVFLDVARCARRGRVEWYKKKIAEKPTLGNVYSLAEEAMTWNTYDLDDARDVEAFATHFFPTQPDVVRRIKALF